MFSVFHFSLQVFTDVTYLLKIWYASVTHLWIFHGDWPGQAKLEKWLQAKLEKHGY